MFSIAFDLVVADTLLHHPSSVSQAYADINSILSEHSFEWVQGSLYLSKTEDLAVLFTAVVALKALPWFPHCVRDIRAFRVDQWSDLTALVKT